MTHDIRVDAAQGLVFSGWRSGPEGLMLSVVGRDEDARLVCRCGRCHWIVHEDDSGEEATLVLICHHCGTRAAFPIERIRTTAR